ncbi:MAG: hypothetical protein Fues2KO_48480 [Fuerstiella sp.]
MTTKLLSPALLVVLLSGCTQSLFNTSLFDASFVPSHTAEQRVVQQFTDAITEDNESALRLIVSTRFENIAMSSADALHDLRVVNLPTGDVSVVDVKESDDGRREVIVKEDAGGKYQFVLVKDTEKGYLTVDDVLVRQKGKSTRAARPTTEVIDLLNTLRTFLDVWATGTREEILAMTSPDLTATLQPLSAGWLQALTARTAESYEEGMARKPEASLTDNDAIVKLPARNGHLMMKIVRVEGAWRVDDVEVHNHRDDNHAGSVRRQAQAINAVAGFLKAYQQADQSALQAAAGEKLYDGSLRVADLSMVQLPDPNQVPGEFDIRTYESRLTMMIPFGQEVVRFDLSEAATPIPAIPGAGPVGFVVEDVTLYNKSTQRQRSLAAVFTAPTRASIFLKALKDRDHDILTHVSSSEFARATWKRAAPEILQNLSVPEFFAGGIRLTGSHDVADITELEFENSEGVLFSCRLVNQHGTLKVDDVQYPNAQGQITSLRAQLELTIPLLELAAAWEARELRHVQRSCSTDFNRLVWSHLEELPSTYERLPSLLKLPHPAVDVGLEKATVKLRHADSGTTLTAELVTEHDFWVVDELKVMSADGRMVDLRANLRKQIASRLLNGSYSMVHSKDGSERFVPVMNELNDARPQYERSASQPVEAPDAINGGIVPAAHATRRPQSDGKVRTASFEQPAGQTNHSKIRPAVHTQIHPADGDFVNQSATVSEDQHVLTDGGVQVFGPQANKVASTLSASRSVQLHEPIDMTEDLPQTAARPAAANDHLTIVPERPASTSELATDSTSRDPGVLYFGPAFDDQVSEPADAPIEVE